MDENVKMLLVQTGNHEKVLAVLKEYSPMPLTIVQISRMSGLSWSTCRNILTELVLTKKVDGFRIGRVLGFKLKETVEVK